VEGSSKINARLRSHRRDEGQFTAWQKLPKAVFGVVLERERGSRPKKTLGMTSPLTESILIKQLAKIRQENRTGTTRRKGRHTVSP
jgi:hypothetical protein